MFRGRAEHLPPLALAGRVLGRLPSTLVAATAGRPVQLDEQVLNPQVQVLLKLGKLQARNRGTTPATAAQARADMRRIIIAGSPFPVGVDVTDLTIPSEEVQIPARLYRGHGVDPAPPIIVYFHGGGWVVGDLDTHDATCRYLATEGRCLVVSVDYRLAPEHPFPAAVDDAVAAYRWVTENASNLGGRPTVGVMGDSAGGNLAAVVAQVTRGTPYAPSLQVLVYPGTSFGPPHPSRFTFASGFALTQEMMDWYRDQYLPRVDDRTDPRASPLLASDLSGIAPLLVFTAGFDPLRDEGHAYAKAAAERGVPTFARCYQAHIHGFFGMNALRDCRQIVRDINTLTGEVLAGVRSLPHSPHTDPELQAAP